MKFQKCSQFDCVYIICSFLETKPSICRYIVTDCDSIDVFYNSQHYTKTPEEAAAKAILAGIRSWISRWIDFTLSTMVKLLPSVFLYFKRKINVKIGFLKCIFTSSFLKNLDEDNIGNKINYILFYLNI